MQVSASSAGVNLQHCCRAGSSLGGLNGLQLLSVLKGRALQHDSKGMQGDLACRPWELHPCVEVMGEHFTRTLYTLL